MRQRRTTLCTDFELETRESICPRVKKRPNELTATCCGQCNYKCANRCVVDMDVRFKHIEPVEPDDRKQWLLNIHKYLKENTNIKHQNYGPLVDHDNPDIRTGDLMVYPGTEICCYCKPIKTKDRRRIKKCY